MDTQRCQKCQRYLNVKRFVFVNTDGLMKRDTVCKGCRRPTKRCPMCEQELPKSAFNSDRSRADGKAVRCRECERKYQREMRRKHCDSCGGEMPKGSRARRCEDCYRKHATERASTVVPHGVLFPGLLRLKRPTVL